MTPARHDAVIIGGGPAGAAAAIALARGGVSTAAIERDAFPRSKVCGEYLSGAGAELLDRLGVGDRWRRLAGPEVRRVGLFCGSAAVTAPMPATGAGGRALGRETLDALLLDEARAAGATVRQPARVEAIRREGDGHAVVISSPAGKCVLTASIVIAAHGSWQPGPLPTQLPRTRRPDDLLGFKAHLAGTALDPELMPLLAFPGGYGGMVTTDGGRVSLSCCIRRDALSRLRHEMPGAPAPEAVFRHVLASCPGAAHALAGAEPPGRWLSAGPIRPGVRSRYADDIFRVGNAAIEAHPIVAEGIGMALRSGRLLADEILRLDDLGPAARSRAGSRYAAASLRLLGPRVAAAAAFAGVADSAAGRWLATALVGGAPLLLTAGARLSGKRA